VKNGRTRGVASLDRESPLSVSQNSRIVGLRARKVAMFQVKIDKIKIDMEALKKEIQPALEKVGLEHVQKSAKKIFTAEEMKQLNFKVVGGKVQTTGPQELIDRLKKELER
jgi:hypothetical protein